MNEVLDIHTTKEHFFLEYLTLKRPILNMIVSKLTGEDITIPTKIINLFALLLYNNDLYSDLNEEDKWKKVFSAEQKKYYMEKLEISAQQLNTYLSILRNYRILNGKKINKPFIITPEKEFSLTFKFSLNGEK